MDDKGFDRDGLITLHEADGRELTTTRGEWYDALIREMHREEQKYFAERERYGRARMSLKRRFGHASTRAFNRLASKDN